VSDKERAEALANNMNIDEGHLGGYIRAGADPAPSGLRVEHGDPATWTPTLWDWAVDTLGVASVLDVGCGEGHAAGYFADRGCEITGVDGSLQAARDSVIPDAHVVHDFQDGPYQPDEPVDLVWSCEFVEHVEERFSMNFLRTFANSSRFVMMTYAPPGQPGWHHVNCQPEQYWVDRLAALGFGLDAALTATARELAGHGHFGGKGLVFARPGALR
ncbi:MAG: class I SAM-dependent methyltransferase, partial [Actinomycetota bacterium]